MTLKTPPVKSGVKVIPFTRKRVAKPQTERVSRHEDQVRLADIIGSTNLPKVHRYGAIPPDTSDEVSRARHASALSAHQDLSALPPEIRESVRIMLETWVAEGGPGSEVLKKIFS